LGCGVCNPYITKIHAFELVNATRLSEPFLKV